MNPNEKAIPIIAIPLARTLVGQTSVTMAIDTLTNHMHNIAFHLAFRSHVITKPAMCSTPTLSSSSPALHIVGHRLVGKVTLSNTTYFTAMCYNTTDLI